MKIEQIIKEIGEEMRTQDKRMTSYVYFVIHEDIKIFGADSEYADGKERKDSDYLDINDLCTECLGLHEAGEEMPDQCENCDDDAFGNYILKKEVPNMYAGFFFTAKAAEEHLKAKRHHYNDTARVFGESACYNPHLQAIMAHLVGEENLNLLR